MSGQLRTLRNRIRSVENTKKITRAMEMVAAAKLHRFQDMMQKSRAYTEGLENLLNRLVRQRRGGFETRPYRELEHPFINPDKRQPASLSSPVLPGIKKGEKIALVLMTSDTGLCGSYNNDLVNMAQRFIRDRGQRSVTIGVGKSGAAALKNMGHPCRYFFTDIRASRVEEILAGFRRNLENLYLSGEADAIYVIYSHFKTLATFKAITEKLLPLERPAEDKKSADEAQDYIFEPSPEIVFQKLVPQFFDAKLRMIFLEAIVSEQIARMTAMHQATKNAKEMIDGLVLKRNKARQASITKELIEIVSGSQALKIK